ncbi:MAG: 2-oxoacid:ferredoxin oxidoreductase subunit beta [Candidatus Aenigmarchaeota archaeon]|nr:2-oxoacid:ferredoxin oxidoreductase subunit beta [Candidatus Aenigmarchaeota archaeon]MCX8179580.1 2-oxoacid:ferredoxin oxidoreductase subunit beta [Candidatus Aenigmarchaeota archaeon]
MTSFEELTTQEKPTWCPGCGNFGILTALKNAIVELNLPKHEVVIVAGIGCSGHLPQWINTFAFHSLHGRALPVAQAIKLANHKLKVIAVGGDGDGYGIGTAHFIHAMRRNVNITYIVHNNQIYGLTTGQASPTSEKGFKSKSTPHGLIEPPVNPIALALASDCSFVARGFAGDVKHLTHLIVQGIQHKGFALIDVLQPCISFNYLNTYEYFMKRVYKLEEDNSYNFTNKRLAFEKAFEWGEKIPIGLFYKEERKTYEDELPQIAEIPLVKQNINEIDISSLIEEMC